MSNMSYCRFENTASDLRDCRRALERLLRGEAEDRGGTITLSQHELPAAKDLIKQCRRVMLLVAEDFDISWEDLDDDAVEQSIDHHMDSANETAAEIDDEERTREEENEERTIKDGVYGSGSSMGTTDPRNEKEVQS
jgi:inorganic pyrophosphatase/exopolyphosphatase